MPHERPKKKLNKFEQPIPKQLAHFDGRRNKVVKQIEHSMKLAIDTPKGQKPPFATLSVLLTQFEREFAGRLTIIQQELIRHIRTEIANEDLSALSKRLDQHTCYLKLTFEAEK